MIKVAIVGVDGRMGRSIFSTLNSDEEIQVTGSTEKPGHSLIGKDLGEAYGYEPIGVLISDSISSASESAEIIVDFSTPESTLTNAEFASRNGKSMVIGTTGFSSAQKNKLNGYLEKIPSVIAPNMSIGVNILFELSKEVSRILGNEFDVEIIEVHHRNKIDSPSGTALGIAEHVAEGLNVNMEKAAVYERHGNIGKRKKGEIGIQTIRGGDVVGDHTILFLGEGERLELTHRALSRDNFSRGVLRAVKWINGKTPGIYNMKDVLGL